ncbi:hypothetical protein C8R41DRAFT_602649 [Lentinula lateritia]|uniref:Transmembrane protein n=1 Tax=Lentinula lateritia TaxID=40482 RepID=A0ABQ8V6W2_9AGAR|nr:hypothetical protein C8R41DRAFT_602649 [Lentinula lateritia]
MLSLSLKLLVISVISLTILVVVNASPILKSTHLTAGHNGESRLIGYLLFLHEMGKSPTCTWKTKTLSFYARFILIPPRKHTMWSVHFFLQCKCTN